MTQLPERALNSASVHPLPAVATGELTLLLMRHATAQPPFYTADHERLLTPAGLEQADRAGQWVLHQGYLPDYALVSSALRTRATFGRMQQQWPQPVLHDLDGALYEASPETLLKAVQGVANSHKTVLLLCHNPGVQLLAEQFITGDSEGQAGSLPAGFAPATLAVVVFRVPQWCTVGLKGGTLKEFVRF